MLTMTPLAVRACSRILICYTLADYDVPMTRSQGVRRLRFIAATFMLTTTPLYPTLRQCVIEAG
jgi:hypothetical protein